MRHHEPTVGEYQHRDVSAQLFVVEGGFVVDEKTGDLLTPQRRGERVEHEIRVVPGPFDRRPQAGRLSGRCAHGPILPRVSRSFHMRRGRLSARSVTRSSVTSAPNR